jgi:hypothetical protein
MSGDLATAIHLLLGAGLGIAVSAIIVWFNEGK